MLAAKAGIVIEAAGILQVIFREVPSLAGLKARLHGADSRKRPAAAAASLVFYRRNLAQGAEVVGRVVSLYPEGSRGFFTFIMRQVHRRRDEAKGMAAAGGGLSRYFLRLVTIFDEQGIQRRRG